MKLEKHCLVPVRQQASTSRDETPGEFSNETHGKTIMALIAAGDKARKQATDRYIAAGKMLDEARSVVPNFTAFLRDHCGGLSRSRAYELIKLACGQGDEVRAYRNERQRRYRTVRYVTDASTVVPRSSCEALAVFERAVETLFPKMDVATRQKALAYACEWGAAPLAREASQCSYKLPKFPSEREVPFEDA
jgi:hypothetical protein